MLEEPTRDSLPASPGVRPHALQLLMTHLQLSQGPRPDDGGVADCDPEAHTRDIQSAQVEGVLALGGSSRRDVVQVGLQKRGECGISEVGTLDPQAVSD